MSWQIIKQPNEKYCIFSSIEDTVIYYGLDRDGIVDAFIVEQRRQAEMMVDGVIKDLEEDRKPYMQFTMDDKEMLETILNACGKEEHDTIKQLISL